MYDAELDANGGYDHLDYEDADNILTDEERELWELETQAAIDADFDARYDAYLANEQPMHDDMAIAAHQPPY